MLGASQSAIVTETLRVALAAAAGDLAGDRLHALARAAAALAPDDVRPPHPAWPAVGTAVEERREVTEDDTAAAMGHPDAAMRVLGSPRLALWFELVSCALLPPPGEGPGHVGAGILVHHLGSAEVGESVTLEATAASVSGRRGVLTCRASVGERLVAIGVHHRVLLADGRDA